MNSVEISEGRAQTRIFSKMSLDDSDDQPGIRNMALLALEYIYDMLSNSNSGDKNNG